jgi:hypothetical protein
MGRHQRGVDLDGLQANLEAPARVAHGILRVRAEVQHNLVHLRRVSQHHTCLSGDVVLQRNGGRQQRP